LKTYIDEFFVDIKNSSLLYFPNTKDYLIDKFKNEFNLPTHSNEVYLSAVDFLSDFYISENVSIESVNTINSRVNNNSSISIKNSSSLGKSRVDGSDNQDNIKVGIVAEKVVYEVLLKQNFKKVEWVSKNAAKAGVNPEGTDTLGYDILYIDENDKINYVEVKGSIANDNQFYISYAEYLFALNNPKNYSIIRVYNTLNNDNRRIVNLGNIFILDDEEELFSNSRFSTKFKTLEINFDINRSV